ncbi:MAG: VCBS repeat-containing protein [Saprospiraceae bacterium]|nr:VCBS repeat-containing protein [Saprospiraceae bacterium]
MIKRNRLRWDLPGSISAVLLILVCTSCGDGFDINQGGDKLFLSVPASHSKIDFQNNVRQTRENNHIVNVEFISGGGVAVGDINNDGLPDLFFTGNQVQDRLYVNRGNFQFQDISKSAGISTDTLWSTGVTFVDIDKDGDQDIYVCRNVYLEDENSANQLYINNGDLTFTESARSFGLADQGFSIQSIFFDFDKDGWVDMYLVNQPPSLPGVGGQLDKSMAKNRLFSDKLYRNTGNGTFEDVTDGAKLRNFAFGLSVSVGDFDNDSWPDLYVTNDFDVPDYIYMNQQDGTFKNTLYEATNHISNFSMGSDVADYDNDGQLDVLVVDMVAESHERIKTHMGAMKPEDFWAQVSTGGHYQYMFNTLQRNNGNGTFSDLAQLAGISNTDWSWAPLFADFDNDGHKDIFVSNGVKNNNRFSDLQTKYDHLLDSLNYEAQKLGIDPQEIIDVMDFVELAPTDKLSNYVYKNNGDLTFKKMVEEWGLDLPTLSNGAAYADFDLDGDLDLVINNIDDHALLYKNNARERQGGNYLRLKLTAQGNESIYGAKISLYKTGKLWQLIQVSNARGFMSKSEDMVHFGLGEDLVVEKVLIEWQNGSVSMLEGIEANQLLEVKQEETKAGDLAGPTSPSTKLFEEVTDLLDVEQATHQENEYDDYLKEPLLPHKMSEFGPVIAVGDVNGDQKEDFFVGGAAGFAGTLYIQNSDGGFDPTENGAWSQDKFSEDMGVAFFDADGDGDLDLFIASGGNEFVAGALELQDRLYLNSGRGKFVKSSSALPSYLISSSCVKPHDFDKDGDIDLFVGGRMVPGQYPNPADSKLLENQGGKFVDITDKKAPGLNALGMVTAACWMDYDQDGRDDLVVVGEWMPVTVFSQSAGQDFEQQEVAGLEDSNGWYYEVQADDIDDDGDEDLVVGNLGLNYKYKATIDEPFEVYSYDFDDNGTLDIVLSYYEHGEAFPVRGKDCSTQQIPSLSEKFTTYNEFGLSNLGDIYGEKLGAALNLQAKTFASAYIENLGDSQFEFKPLPNLAQVSSVNNIMIKDYDQDGHKDLLISGNLFQSEIETPRNDAGAGLLLKGNGQGDFEAVPLGHSGFFAPHDAKDMKAIRLGTKEVILVANNKHKLQTWIVGNPPSL